MIELRPRKLARLHVSVSGSDRPEGNAEEGGSAQPAPVKACVQVPGGATAQSALVKNKRGRKPKIAAPHLCKGGKGEPQIGLDNAHSKEEKPNVSHICAQVKKRGRKPKISAPLQCKEEAAECHLGLDKDKPDVSHICRKNGLQSGQVKKRGRKPKISAPLQCKEEGGDCERGLDEAHCTEVKSHVSHVCQKNALLSEQVKKRGRKPKIANCCGLPSCAREVLRPQKKRGRKPKTKKSEGTRVKSCPRPKGIGNKKITSVGGRRARDAVQQTGSAQNSVVSGLCKRRKAETHPVVGKSAATSGMNVDLSGRTSELEQVSLCHGNGCQPDRKGERKAGSLLWKAVKHESPGEDMKGVGSAEKSQIHTIHVRVQRSLLRQVSEKKVVSSEHLSKVKTPHPDPMHGEEWNESSEPSKPRNSRRTKHVNSISTVQKTETIPAEQDTNYLRTASEKRSVLQNEENAVMADMSESNMTKCSSKTCHVHSPDLPNPVVKLPNCKGLHHIHSSIKRPPALGTMLTNVNAPSHISLTDKDSNSAIEDVNNSENVESTSTISNKNRKPSLLKVKLNFRKRDQKISSHSKESNVELNSNDCGSKEMTCDTMPEPKPAESQNGHLMDKMNNNTIISAGLDATQQENKDGIIWGIWRSQTSFVSDEEITEHDLNKSNSIAPCSDINQAKEEFLITCQRALPFTGKTIRKCSCARTYVSDIPRKRPADVQSTIILGIEAERSLEIYLNDKDSLFKGIDGERTEGTDCESISKKRRLDLHKERTSYPIAPCETLDESLFRENTNERLSASDTNLPLLLTSEPSVGVELGEHWAQGKTTDDKCSSTLASNESILVELLSSEHKSVSETLFSTSVTSLSSPLISKPSRESVYAEHSETSSQDKTPIDKRSKVHLSSCEVQLDESFPSETKDVTDTQLSSSDISDLSIYFPLASEPSWENVECRKHYTQGTAPNDDKRLSNFAATLDESVVGETKGVKVLCTSDTSLPLTLASQPSIEIEGAESSQNCAQDTTTYDDFQAPQFKHEDSTRLFPKSPSKTVTEIEKPIPNPFKVPAEETVTLLHGQGSVLCSTNKDLKNEVCSSYTPLEKVGTGVLKENPKHSHSQSYCEDSQSYCYLSEWYDTGDLVEHEVFNITAPRSPERSTSHTIDLWKAYEEDVLVIDVIQDDPELFSTDEKRGSSIKKYCNANHITSSDPKEKPLTSEVQKVVPPSCGSKSGMRRIEYVSENIDSVNDFFNDQQDTLNFLPMKDQIRTDVEMEESRSPTESQDKVGPEELHSDSVVDESKSSPLFGEVLPSQQVPRPPQPIFHHSKTESPLLNRPPPLMREFHSNRMNMSTPEMAASDMEKWKHERPSPRIQQSRLPFSYCKFFFNRFNGCTAKQCAYVHVPKMCDEQVCMDVLHKLINENSTFLLKRAVWIFTNYYSQYPPRHHYDRSIFGALLNPLLRLCLWPDLFHLLETAAAAKIFPSFEQIVKIFESVAFSGLQAAFSTLMEIFCKFVHGGMNITYVEINHIIAIVSKSNAAKNHINILLSMKSSLEMKHQKPNWSYDINAAISEVECCKVSSDWMKLGTLYLTFCAGCENLTNLKNFSRCVAEALMKDSINERPEIPYCEFADAIFKNPKFNDIHKNILGRIGISIMFFYHHKELWLKGRKVICKMHELKINYTVLKGLLGQDSVVSRCHVINIAVEIFFKSGNLGGAVQTLKDSDWMIKTSLWPCSMMDVLHRHNLMCLLVNEALSKNMLTLCFEVLQNLPGFQESQAELNVSQYAGLFNKVLNTCVENRSIGMSSAVIDFMIAKKITIDYANLRGFITTLGNSSLWTKARAYYKSALALGYYPLFEEKIHPHVLYIPSFMSEVEMLMTIEHFMVANVSSIQSQNGCNQSLQIVLRRLEEDSAKCKDLYHAAADRLLEAGRLSTPRLFIKHMTVNNANEQVYTLDNNSSLKWLNENMKWASNVWYGY